MLPLYNGTKNSIYTDIFCVIDSAPLISNEVNCNVCEKIFQIFEQSAKKGDPTEVCFSLL